MRQASVRNASPRRSPYRGKTFPALWPWFALSKLLDSGPFRQDNRRSWHSARASSRSEKSHWRGRRPPVPLSTSTRLRIRPPAEQRKAQDGRLSGRSTYGRIARSNAAPFSSFYECPAYVRPEGMAAGLGRSRRQLADSKRICKYTDLPHGHAAVRSPSNSCWGG